MLPKKNWKKIQNLILNFNIFPPSFSPLSWHSLPKWNRFFFLPKIQWKGQRIRRGWEHKFSLHHYLGDREGEHRWWVEPSRWRPCPRTTTNQFQNWMTKNSARLLSRKAVAPSSLGTTKFVCCVGYIEVQTHFHNTLNATHPAQHFEHHTVVCKHTRQTDWQESITSGFWLCCGGGGDRQCEQNGSWVGPFKRTRTREEVNMQWSRDVVSAGLPMSFFDNKEVRKSVLFTAECGSNYIGT